MRNLHKYYYKDYFRNLDFSYLLETDAKAPDSVKNEIKRRNSVLTGDEYAQNPRQAHSPLRQEAKIIVFDPTSDGRCDPILKIDESDITASHAATVGKLNEDEQFYMRSRGIPEDEAKVLQMISFVAPVLDGIEDEALVQRIEEAIRSLAL